MTDPDRVDSFLRSIAGTDDAVLTGIRKENEEEGIPLIRKEEEAVLSFFASEKQRKAFLEIGTGAGYSGILLLKNAAEDAFLTTVEIDGRRREKALLNFEKAGVLSRVESLLGDAEEVLPRLTDTSFDLIFLDSAKGQYVKLLPELLRLLREDGVLLADNIFSSGRLLDPRSLCVRRDRTIHENLRQFLRAVFSEESLQSMLIPAGDGILAARKKSTV